MLLSFQSDTHTLWILFYSSYFIYLNRGRSTFNRLYVQTKTWAQIRYFPKSKNLLYTKRDRLTAIDKRCSSSTEVKSWLKYCECLCMRRQSLHRYAHMYSCTDVLLVYFCKIHWRSFFAANKLFDFIWTRKTRRPHTFSSYFFRTTKFSAYFRWCSAFLIVHSFQLT